MWWLLVAPHIASGVVAAHLAGVDEAYGKPWSTETLRNSVTGYLETRTDTHSVAGIVLALCVFWPLAALMLVARLSKQRPLRAIEHARELASAEREVDRLLASEGRK